MSTKNTIVLHFVKPLSDYANDDQIEMQDDQLKAKVAEHEDAESEVMFPEEYSILDGNYAVVYSPKDADLEDVAKAVMAQESA